MPSPLLLLQLPNEILDIIYSYLPISAVNSLLQTCRLLHSILSPQIYPSGITTPSAQHLINVIMHHPASTLSHLLSVGLPVHSKVDRITGGTGRTLLHAAVMHRREDLISVLLAHGADVNVPDDRGASPLLYTTYANKDIVKVLRNAGGLMKRWDIDYDEQLNVLLQRLNPGLNPGPGLS